MALNVEPALAISNELVNQIGQMISQAQNIAIFSHIRPDGDAAGSILGLGLVLEEAGKQVQMILADGVPGSTRHLVGSNKIQKELNQPFELSIVVDSSDQERIGAVLPEGYTPDINIDHHPTNLYFARTNLVVDQAVSTSVIITQLLQELGYPISPEAASALLTGLVTDSLGFRTPNMNPQALHTAANLMEMGADLPQLYYEALTRRSYEAARLWGVGLSNLQRKNGLIWTTISLAERRAIGYSGDDDADLVNTLPTISGVKVAIILLEQPNGHVKISWRSKLGYDISNLALSLGGGGHKNAAGAMLEGPLDEVEKRIISATQEHIQSQSADL